MQLVTKKKGSSNSVRRSIARGASSRGTTGINDNGKNAYKKARKTTKGTYRVSFTEIFSNASEKEVDNRIGIGKMLISSFLGTPEDMISFIPKRKKAIQTLTASDEVFYVKIGTDTAGKCSIRTQRLRNKLMLMFVFQERKIAQKSPEKPFSRKLTFSKRTSSQKAQASRKSYRKRGNK